MAKQTKPEDFDIAPDQVETPTWNETVKKSETGLKSYGGGMVPAPSRPLRSPNFVSGRLGWNIDSDGTAEFQDVNLGHRRIAVKAGDSIQEAIDKVNAVGGGLVLIRNGTHTVTADITLYSNVYLQGENAASAIIDFGNNTRSILIVGTDAYSTGTVDITNNSTTVTGNGTTFTSSMVGQKILVADVWYTIAAFTNTTTIHIAAPFATKTVSTAAYVIATTKADVKITDLTVRTGNAGIKVQYGEEIFIHDIDVQTSVIGIDIDDSSQVNLDQVDIVACNSSYTFDNAHLISMNGCGSIDALAGNGMTLDNCSNMGINQQFLLNSSADGLNMTDCSNVSFGATTILENGGQGIELVSGNSDIIIGGCAIEDNAGDGIKLTATTDRCHFSNSSIKDNGAYGVNVAAATCDDNIILGNVFSGNSTAATDDSGTTTLIRSNIGQADN